MNYSRLMKDIIKLTKGFQRHNENTQKKVLFKHKDKWGIRESLFELAIENHSPRRKLLFSTLLRAFVVLGLLGICINMLSKTDSFRELHVIMHVGTALFICALPQIVNRVCKKEDSAKIDPVSVLFGVKFQKKLRNAFRVDKYHAFINSPTLVNFRWRATQLIEAMRTPVLLASIVLLLLHICCGIAYHLDNNEVKTTSTEENGTLSRGLIVFPHSKNMKQTVKRTDGHTIDTYSNHGTVSSVEKAELNGQEDSVSEECSRQ
ncbi:hypothetical protein MAR_021984 [Mya arenaria]|uniref:Uncharacterized protein n=1 Tax=Mya arenaria TaxID=6604 RepID=A0ABY7E9T5_MYAAR|nr:hypothetical protein MAR_021984 [Mya arenaria]